MLNAAPWWEDEFTISYWESPPCDRLNERMVGEIADMGFTVMGRLTAPEKSARNIMDMASAHALKVMIRDDRIERRARAPFQQPSP